MACRHTLEAKGPADFSGYWRLAKTENFDVFLQHIGLPWVVRKAALKFAGNAIDVVSHTGSIVKIVSLNAKGSWTRSYDTEREVVQKNAEGVLCETTAWWEGKVFRARMEGSPLGPCESWRYMRNGIMVVKTAVKLISGGETSMYWYFEIMEVLHRHLGGQGRYHLLRRIERDQRQVEKATRGDNRYLQKVLMDWDRWNSPADEFILVVSPSYSRTRLKAAPHAGSPHVSQGNLSKSPSASSLGSPLGDLRSEGRSARSDVGSRSRLCSESTSALDKAGITDLAKADTMVAAAAAEAQAGPSNSAVAGAGAAATPGRRDLHRDISLAPYRQEEQAAEDAGAAEGAGGAAPAPAGGAREHANGALCPPWPVQQGAPDDADDGCGLTFHPGEAHGPPPSPTHLRGRPGMGGGGGAVGVAASAAPSDQATMGSGSIVDAAEAQSGHGARGASAGSLGALAGLRHHQRKLSGEGVGSEGRPSLRPTPRSTPTHRQMPTGGEALLAFKAHEYLDSRGITAVVPVATPNDTAEPQLLCMSPEQAEQTHAKLRELEEEMLLQRQEYRKGVTCCGCLFVSRVSSSLPDHLRTWEMSVS